MAVLRFVSRLVGFFELSRPNCHSATPLLALALTCSFVSVVSNLTCSAAVAGGHQGSDEGMFRRWRSGWSVGLVAAMLLAVAYPSRARCEHDRECGPGSFCDAQSICSDWAATLPPPAREASLLYILFFFMTVCVCYTTPPPPPRLSPLGLPYMCTVYPVAQRRYGVQISALSAVSAAGLAGLCAVMSPLVVPVCVELSSMLLPCSTTTEVRLVQFDLLHPRGLTRRLLLRTPPPASMARRGLSVVCRGNGGSQQRGRDRPGDSVACHRARHRPGGAGHRGRTGVLCRGRPGCGPLLRPADGGSTAARSAGETVFECSFAPSVVGCFMCGV